MLISLLRIMTPASLVLLLLIFRFLFMQIPKLRHIVSKTNYRIPIKEFQIYTKLYVITSISGIFTICLTQDLISHNWKLDSLLCILYLSLYSITIYQVLISDYFNRIWKSRKVMYLSYIIFTVSLFWTMYQKFSQVGIQMYLISLSLINWTPVLLFIYGLVAVKDNALNYNTTQGIEKYQPTHEFLQFTEKETKLSNELLEEYKKHDFYNFAFYCLFLFMITENSFNKDGSEFLSLQLFGLAIYAVVNLYLFNWYGTCFDDFRQLDKDISSFKSSVELTF